MTKSFADLLTAIGDTTRPLPSAELYRLSDMKPDSAAAYAAAWSTMDVHRRRELMRKLADDCRTNFEVDFRPVALIALEDADHLVRLAAIDTFWDAESPQYVRPMLELALGDPVTAVRANAARALGCFVLQGELGRLPGPIFQELVAKLLGIVKDPDREPLVRCHALESLAAADVGEINDLILDAYASEEEAFRVSAVSAMGRTSDPAWEPIVLNEMANVSPAVRYHAARAAGLLELRTAVPLLVECLEDPDPQVIAAAIWSLGEIGGQQAQDALESVLDDEEFGVPILEALEKIDIAAGMPTLFPFDEGA